LNRNKTVEFFLLAVALIWALNFTVVKASLEQFDPMSFNALRFIMAIVFMLVVMMRRSEKLVIHKGDWGKILFLGFLGNLVYQFLFIYGISLTLAANAAVMLGTIPVWIAVLGHFFFGEKITRIKLFGIIFAFGGVVLIMKGSEKGITLASETIVGDLVILASAAVFGIYTLFTKKMLSRYTPIQFTTLMMLTGGLALVIAGLPWLLTMDFAAVTPAGWIGVFYSGFLSIGIAYVIWNYGVRQVGPVRTATFQNLVPVLGLIFGVILLNEKLYLMQYFGAASVIAGIILARK
jgi:drug/metabolite transporter (DMT)-like permease